MKRIFVVLCMSFVIVFLNAQIKVGTNNCVGIRSSNPQSILSINSSGDSDYTLYGYDAQQDRMAKFELDSSTGDYAVALASIIRINSAIKPIAGNFWAYQSELHTKRTYGVRATVGNGYNGYNYGVYGSLHGSRNGAAIIGVLSGYEPSIDGMYTGYFAGNARVTDTLWVDDALFVDNIQVTSDIRLKSDVKTLKSSVGERVNLDNLLSLNPIEYKLRTPDITIPQSDTATINSPEISSLPEYNRDTSKVHFGLSAQELQQFYPELVSESKGGYLAVDYIGLIPILIEGMREQQIIIEGLISDLEELRSAQIKTQ